MVKVVEKNFEHQRPAAPVPVVSFVTWNFVTDSKNLSAQEKRKFIWLVAEYLFLVESLYRQRQLGFLGHDSWNQHQSAVAGLLLHPVIDSWWESGVSPYSPEFREAINAARTELGDAIWSYTPLSDL